MIKLNDQLGESISLQNPAQRIVCLVPSITELLWNLNLQDQIVGRTKFCILPKELKTSIPQIGGTKTVHYDKIRSLNPDLIICNKEENTEEIVTRLKEHFPVYVSNIQSIHSALEMISDIGILCNRRVEADKLVDKIETKRIAWHSQKHEERTCLYLIWKKPFMTIGVDTFIYTMLKEMNFESVLYDFRYPELSIDQIKKLNPNYLLLSSEPFPFKQKDLDEIQELFPKSKPILVDGTYFSWYGNRILESYSYFEKLNLQLQ